MNKKILTVFLLFIFLVLACLLGGQIYFSSKIMPHTYIEDEEISFVKIEELNTIIKNKINKLNNQKIKMKFQDEIKEFSFNEMGISFKEGNIQEEIKNVQKNFISNIPSLLKKEKRNYSLTVELDEAKFHSFIENNIEIIIKESKDVTLEFKNNKVKIIGGEEGEKINVERLKEKLIEVANQRDNEIEIPTITISPKLSEEYFEEMVEKYYSKPIKKASNAKFTRKNKQFQVIEEVRGVELDKDKLYKDLQKAIGEGKKEIDIPVKEIIPEITKKDMEKIVNEINNVIGSYTTHFNSSQVDRSHNIRLAAQSIDGTILAPGEIFDYNRTTGRRTKENGYREATVISNGEFVTGVGGGVCQGSSTLYNAALLANLEIIERHPHGLAVSYIPLSRDAAVSWGYQNLRFKNTTNNYIYIEAIAGKDYVTFNIYGEKKDVEVVIESERLETISPSVVKVKDNTLPVGEEKVVKQGQNGYRSQAWKIVKKDGKVISRERLSKDYYKPSNKVVNVGTKVIENNGQLPNG